GKRHFTERPAAVERRKEFWHWEIDTVAGKGTKDCVLTLVERTTGCVLIGKLPNHTVDALNQRLLQIIAGYPHLLKTITADNATKFQCFLPIEQLAGVEIYFATP